MFHNIEVRDCICACGRRLHIPAKSVYSDPFYVEHVRHMNVKLEKEFFVLRDQLLELAGECVDAGVRPAMLRRADEMRAKLDELLEMFREQERWRQGGE